MLNSVVINSLMVSHFKTISKPIVKGKRNVILILLILFEMSQMSSMMKPFTKRKKFAFISIHKFTFNINVILKIFYQISKQLASL